MKHAFKTKRFVVTLKKTTIELSFSSFLLKSIFIGVLPEQTTFMNKNVFSAFTDLFMLMKIE